MTGLAHFDSEAVDHVSFEIGARRTMLDSCLCTPHALLKGVGITIH